MLVIKYITVGNAKRAISKPENKREILYDIHIALSSEPVMRWKRMFYYEWKRKGSHRNIKIVNNEVRLCLNAGDDIQLYIERIKLLIARCDEKIRNFEQKHIGEYDMDNYSPIKRFKLVKFNDEYLYRTASV